MSCGPAAGEDGPAEAMALLSIHHRPRAHSLCDTDRRDASCTLQDVDGQEGRGGEWSQGTEGKETPEP